MREIAQGRPVLDRMEKWLCLQRNLLLCIHCTELFSTRAGSEERSGMRLRMRNCLFQTPVGEGGFSSNFLCIFFPLKHVF